MDKRGEDHAAAIEPILRQMVRRQEELLALLEDKHQAMRRADVAMMPELCALENQKVQALSELEKQRLDLVAQWTLTVRGEAARPMRLEELADRLPEPRRSGLLDLRRELRSKLAAVKEQTTITQRALQALIKHAHGLTRAIHAASVGGTTYGRGGDAAEPGVGLSTVNTTA